MAETVRARCDKPRNQVIGAAIEVHRELGPGLLESAYELALCRELGLRGVQTDRQVVEPLQYRGEALDEGCRIDELVEGLVVVELISIKAIEPIHEA